MSTPRPHQSNAWMLLLATAVPAIYGPLAHLVSGRPLAAGMQFWKNDPATHPARSWADLVAQHPETASVISGHVRMMAILGLAFGVLFVAVVSTAFRRGERWAWFAAWSYPAAILGFAAVATIHDGWWEDSWALPSLVVVVGVVIVGLLLPVRVFFGRREGCSNRSDGG